MKSYFYMALAIFVSLILSLNPVKLVSLDEMGLFLTVIGIIYGLMAAFTISNAWERFSVIRDSISEETYALTSAYIYAEELSDKSGFGKFKAKLLEYCEEVPKVSWRLYWHSEKTHQKFRDIIKIVAQMKLKNIKDEHLFDEITTDLEDAARARSSQLVLSHTRISSIQWILNIALSLFLVAGLVFTSLPDYKLSIFIIFSMISSVLMILVVMYELDTMKVYEEEISNEPYWQIIHIIRGDKKSVLTDAGPDVFV